MVGTLTLGFAVLVLVGVAVAVLLRSDAESGAPKSEAESASQTVAEFTAAVRHLQWLEGLRGVAAALFVLPVALVTPVLRLLPGTWRLYHMVHTWSAWQMQRAASADALANVRHPNDREDVLPAKMVEGGEDEKQRTGWKVKGIDDKRYDTGVRGGATSRFGKADLIHINEDDTEQGSWAEAAIDQAFQSDRERYLFRNAEVDLTYNVVGNQAAAGQEAVADGGQQGNWDVASYDVSLTRPGILEDVLAPLASPSGYDGQVVSFGQYSEIKSAKADQEKVRQAKNAGWMSAKLDDIERRDLMKWLIIGLVWSMLLLFHQDIGAFIAGFSGGNPASSAAGGAGLGMLWPSNLLSAGVV